MSEHLDKIKVKSKELLDTMGFSTDIIISQRNNVLLLNMQIDEPGLLIGRAGEGLESLQHLLRLLLAETISEIGNILVVDINGYRNKKIASIEKAARDAASKARLQGIEVELSPMNSFERRMVHTLVSNIADVESESIGSHQDRRVVIKPKKK